VNRILVALAFALIARLAYVPFAHADEPLVVSGSLDQGGLLVGHLPPGSHLKANGADVPLAASGAFAIGLAREAGPKLLLTAELPDGRSIVRELAVAKRDWDIQRIDGLPEGKVSEFSTADVAAIKDEQRKIADSRSHVRDADSFADGFAWPAHGPISGVYGSQRILNGQPRAPHLGLDIAAPEGTPVAAAADGIVRLVGPGLFFNGNVIVLDHGLGLTTIYAHLSRIDVKQGQPVRKGAIIGAVGKSGRVTGPHLHFGLNLRGVGLDPAQVLGVQSAATTPPAL
jgi:murein DD-endopeptidase MepM/ murein hydrolase activator NlpD